MGCCHTLRWHKRLTYPPGESCGASKLELNMYSNPYQTFNRAQQRHSAAENCALHGMLLVCVSLHTHTK